jgi:hypothetical protein
MAIYAPFMPNLRIFMKQIRLNYSSLSYGKLLWHTKSRIVKFSESCIAVCLCTLQKSVKLALVCRTRSDNALKLKFLAFLFVFQEK